MVELGDHLDLPEETLRAEHGGQFGNEDLDGNLASVPKVIGEVDHGHPAPAQDARGPVGARFEPVAVSDTSLKFRTRIGHWRSSPLGSSNNRASSARTWRTAGWTEDSGSYLSAR